MVTTVSVTAGGTYTLLALDDPQGGLTLRTIRESWSDFSRTGSVPTTGIDTGGDGTAPDPTGSRPLDLGAPSAGSPRTAVREPAP